MDQMKSDSFTAHIGKRWAAWKQKNVTCDYRNQGTFFFFGGLSRKQLRQVTGYRKREK